MRTLIEALLVVLCVAVCIVMGAADLAMLGVI